MVPLHDENMRTSNPIYYVAGDIAGVEEASTAIEEGRLAGIAAAESLGLSNEKTAEKKQAVRDNLAALRSGAFGQRRFLAKEEMVKEFYREAEV